MSEEKIIELMKDNGYSEIYAEEQEWGEKLLSFEDALIDFYFEDKNLVTVNWSIDFLNEE
jgi:pyruvoyl-dependent arginine decarboxylase (PvlArgDC)